MPTNYWDWAKLIIAIVCSGLGGAILTLIVTAQKNKIQTVRRRLSISYIDLPKTVEGFTTNIYLKKMSEKESEHYFFNLLAIVQIELINTGNKDIPNFVLGVNTPGESEIISAQFESRDRHHAVKINPAITIKTPATEIDADIYPFNRKDRYIITLVINTTNKNLKDELKLSNALPIRFVDEDISEKIFPTKLLAAMTAGITIAGAASIFDTVKTAQSNKAELFGVAAGIIAVLGIMITFSTYLLNRNRRD